MKVIDRKGILFNKISVVDLAIVLMIVVLGLVAWSYFGNTSTTTSNRIPVQYVYETTDVPKSFTEQIEIGGNVYNSNKNSYVGVVVDLDVQPYLMAVPDLSEGVFKNQLVKDRYIVRITIQADSVQDNYHIWVNQENIKVGAMFPIKGKGFASYGYVVGIKEGIQ